MAPRKLFSNKKEESIYLKWFVPAHKGDLDIYAYQVEVCQNTRENCKKPETVWNFLNKVIPSVSPHKKTFKSTMG